MRILRSCSDAVRTMQTTAGRFSVTLTTGGMSIAGRRSAPAMGRLPHGNGEPRSACGVGPIGGHAHDQHRHRQPHEPQQARRRGSDTRRHSRCAPRDRAPGPRLRRPAPSCHSATFTWTPLTFCRSVRSRSDAAALVPRRRAGGPADHGIAIDCKNPEVGRVPPGSSSTVVTRFIYRWRRGSDGASPTSISIRRCTPLTAASSGSACTSRISRWCARCSNTSDCMISPSRTRRALISGRSSTSSDSPVHRAAHGLDASEFPCSIAYRRRQSRGRRGRP